MEWISVIITAALGSIVVCFLILLINESGKRGQAITWLPASLATTIAVTHVTNPDELERLLQTAFATILISGCFIMTFYILLNVLVPDSSKKLPSVERQDTILTVMIIVALALPGFIVWAIEQYANPFWSLVIGFVGVGLVIVNVMCSKRLHFKQQSIKLGFKAACSCCCAKGVKIDKKEIYMLSGAVVGTFAFVVIPALLADAGYANWAGIVANAPKITVLIMISLWIKRPVKPTREQDNELKQEIKEHLTMFSYSTTITAIYILIMWWNESQPVKEDFWWAWSVALVISLAFITGILVPVCLQSSPPKEGARGPRDSAPAVEATNPDALLLTTVQQANTELRLAVGYPKLKW
jgi:hypothetical protein